MFIVAVRSEFHQALKPLDCKAVSQNENVKLHVECSEHFFFSGNSSLKWDFLLQISLSVHSHCSSLSV